MATFFEPRAIKNLKKYPKTDIENIIKAVESLSNNFEGDIKKLTGTSHEYRLRIGKYRVLFELENNEIIIYDILLRKDAYR